MRRASSGSSMKTFVGAIRRCKRPTAFHPEDLIDPNFTFVIAKIDSSAVGYGALRRFEPGIGEIKRMFVVSKAPS
jgi:hypothetical protein